MRVQMKNILCATDFSDFSNHTIPYGVALAKEFDAKLYICHVIDLSSIAIYGEFQLNPVDQQNRIRKQATEQLDHIIGEQPVKWEPLITVGHTADEVSRLVEEKGIDLVIAATRGRSGLKRLILGSVTPDARAAVPIAGCPQPGARICQSDQSGDPPEKNPGGMRFLTGFRSGVSARIKPGPGI